MWFSGRWSGVRMALQQMAENQTQLEARKQPLMGKWRGGCHFLSAPTRHETLSIYNNQNTVKRHKVQNHSDIYTDQQWPTGRNFSDIICLPMSTFQRYPIPNPHPFHRLTSPKVMPTWILETTLLPQTLKHFLKHKKSERKMCDMQIAVILLKMWTWKNHGLFCDVKKRCVAENDNIKFPWKPNPWKRITKQFIGKQQQCIKSIDSNDQGMHCNDVTILWRDIFVTP